MSPLGRARQSGMSLVELMVGMAIGLIGITIITHLYLVNEKYKRSTTGSGTAQVNGAIALYHKRAILDEDRAWLAASAYEIRKPRIAMYQRYGGGNMDEPCAYAALTKVLGIQPPPPTAKP